MTPAQIAEALLEINGEFVDRARPHSEGRYVLGERDFHYIADLIDNLMYEMLRMDRASRLKKSGKIQIRVIQGGKK